MVNHPRCSFFIYMVNVILLLVKNAFVPDKWGS